MSRRRLPPKLSSGLVFGLVAVASLLSGPVRAAPDALACAVNYWAFALLNPEKAQAGQARARQLIKGYSDQTPGQSYEAVAKDVDVKGRELAGNIHYLKTEAARLVYQIEIRPGSNAEKKALADQEYAKRKSYLDLENTLMADLANCEKRYFNKSP